MKTKTVERTPKPTSLPGSKRNDFSWWEYIEALNANPLRPVCFPETFPPMTDSLRQHRVNSAAEMIAALKG